MLDWPCAVEDPTDDADSDEADDKVELDDTTIGGGADMEEVEYAEELEDALTGYFVSMFSLGTHPIGCFGGYSSRPQEDTRNDRWFTSNRLTQCARPIILRVKRGIKFFRLPLTDEYVSFGEWRDDPDRGFGAWPGRVPHAPPGSFCL